MISKLSPGQKSNKIKWNRKIADIKNELFEA